MNHTLAALVGWSYLLLVTLAAAAYLLHRWL